MSSSSATTKPAPDYPAAERRAGWIGVAVIVLAGIAAYANSLRGPFVFDDPSSITANLTIRHLWPPWAPFIPPHAAVTVQGRPVLNFSLALNYAISGEAVWSYHALNLAIHLAAGLALFGLLRRTLRRPVVAERVRAAADSLALASAVLWVVHPLQTQAVTYVIQRAESLMGLFYLLTLYCFARGAEAPARAGRWLAAAVAACFLGMGTKEVMVSAPVIVLLFDRAFFAGSLVSAWRIRRGFYLALASGWLLLAVLVASAGGNRGGSAGFDVGVGWWDYALTQFVALAHYLRLAVWPSPLVFEYGTFWVDRVAPTLPAIVLVAGLAVASLLATWRRPAFGFPGFFFFSILAVTSLVPGTTQMIVEHRMYLPLAPVIVGAVLLAHRYLGRRALAGWALLAVGLTAATHLRNRDYGSEIHLWEDTIAKRPNNALAHEMLAQAYERTGDIGPAMTHRKRALEIFPTFAVAHCNLADSLGRRGQMDEAISHYEAALRTKPDYADAHNGLGGALAQTGRVAEAIPHLARAIELSPDFAEAHHNLANALSAAGRTAEAIPHYERARQLSPSVAAIHYNLGNALAELGRNEEAFRAYAEALRLAPEHARTHYNLGNLFLRLGQKPEAAERFAAATKLDPQFAEAGANLGFVLLELGEPMAALREFDRVIQFAPNQATVHLGRGNALAVLGQPGPARNAYNRALALDPQLAPAREGLRRLEVPTQPSARR